ncbi:MAG: AAA family ATPase [Lachnospiraceae bacterium]|nr:AAA family ATPase [Lachnospiraceae bacterium]
MNNTFYGLSCNPFDKQAPSETGFFESFDHKQMISRLNYLKDVRGIGVFTASPGMGKSYALRCFQHSLNKNLYHMKYICLSTISVAEFYKQLCDHLGLDAKGGKTVMFKAIQDRRYYLYKDKRQPFILAIDEAQYLNHGILKDLKMLMNFSYDSLNCFSLILSGETLLNRTLEKPVHEALRQRITVHYTFQGLQTDEVTAYIYHKLALAGGSRAIMGEDALSAVTRYCQRNPRIIDTIMTNALTLGAQTQKQVIDSEIILAAVNEQTLG